MKYATQSHFLFFFFISNSHAITSLSTVSLDKFSSTNCLSTAYGLLSAKCIGYIPTSSNNQIFQNITKTVTENSFTEMLKHVNDPMHKFNLIFILNVSMLVVRWQPFTSLLDMSFPLLWRVTFGRESKFAYQQWNNSIFKYRMKKNKNIYYIEESNWKEELCWENRLHL